MGFLVNSYILIPPLDPLIEESGTAFTGWVYSAGSLNATTGYGNGGYQATLTYDLGLTLDNKWVLDFEMRGNSGNAGDTNFFGISDDATAGQKDYGNDGAGFAQVNRSKDMMRNPAGQDGSQDTDSLGIADGVYYDYSIRYDGTNIKLYREGTTSTALTLAWTDAGNLQYIIMEYYVPGGVDWGGNFNIRNVKMYNGIDTPP